MTKDLGKISAVGDMIGSIKKQCQDYRQIKKLTGMTNNTMEDIDKFLQQLEEELSRLKET